MQVVLMSLMVGTSIEAFFLVRENKTKALKGKAKKQQNSENQPPPGNTQKPVLSAIVCLFVVCLFVCLIVCFSCPFVHRV